MSCDALAKGFDVPDVRVCILCRPLRKSLTTHIQQIGRVMRSAPGKDKALVIDHTGNALRFLHDTVDFWANGVDRLDESAEKDRTARTVTPKERKELVCFGCQAIMPPGSPVCLACGRERPAQAVRGHDRQRRHATADVERRIGPRNSTTATIRSCATTSSRLQSFLSFTTPRKRGDVEAARKWAAGMYKGVYGRWPPRTLDDLPHDPALLTLRRRAASASERWRATPSRGPQHAA